MTKTMERQDEETTVSQEQSDCHAHMTSKYDQIAFEKKSLTQDCTLRLNERQSQMKINATKAQLAVRLFNQRQEKMLSSTA